MENITYPDGATPLDPDEIRGLKFKHITTRNQLDQLEQANIQTGLRWLARRKNSDILHEGFVRDQALRMADMGDYKNLLAFIGETPRD